LENKNTRPFGSKVTELKISDHPDVGFENLDIEYNHPVTSSHQEASMRIFKKCPIILAGNILTDGTFTPAVEDTVKFENIDISERAATFRGLFLGVCNNCELFTGVNGPCGGFRKEFKK
jgi:hypothetical protein